MTEGVGEVAERLEVSRLRAENARLASLLAPFLKEPMRGYDRGNPQCIFCGSSSGEYTRWLGLYDPDLDSWAWQHWAGCPTQDAELMELVALVAAVGESQG